MLFRDLIQLVLRAIIAQRLRSALTLSGIAVGIAAVILLTSIGEGVHQYVLQQFSQFGTHIIQISPGRTQTTGGAPPGLPSTVRPLTLEDASALQRVPMVTGLTPEAWGNAEIEAASAAGNRSRRTTVYGVGPQMPAVFSSKVRVGRFLPDDDDQGARAFVVLGSTLRRELFGNENPLGARVRIAGQHFRVIGVMESKGQMLGYDLNDVVFIPAAQALTLFNRDGLMRISVAYREDARASQVSDAVRGLLTARHGREDFTLTTQEDMLRSLSKILNILTAAVGAIGSISLLVGGVGIVTIMTIAVAERRQEIGLMVALGARRRSVLVIFLAEAVVLSALGGLIGLVLGVGVSQALSLALPGLPLRTPMQFVLIAEAVAILIGLVAGVLPARSAALLDPVDALRSE